MTFAKETTVSVERTRAELEQLLIRFGASGYFSGWDAAANAGFVAFELRGRRLRFRLDLPDPNNTEFTMRKLNQTNYREQRTPAQARAAWEQACRQRWRALLLLVKAKLAAIEAGIVTLEEAFLADVMLPDGRTVGESVMEPVAEAYRSGQVPPLLPGLRPALMEPKD
jgi:hypothetical protein